MLITLDNLRQTLQAVKNKLDGITSRVSTVESSVNTMSSNMVNSVNGQTGAVTGIATTSEVDALETRVDNIITPSGDPSLTEITDARVGADSTVYSTLKGRIDGEVSELNERLDDEIADVKDDLQNAIQTEASNRVRGDAENRQRIQTVQNNVDTLASTVNSNLTRKVNQPLNSGGQPVNGTNGQVLRTKGNGSTEWATVGLPTDEQTAEAVEAWLDEHPEATTTVQDSSITEPKLANALAKKVINAYVTPQSFGAVGDGVTDDTAAFTSFWAADAIKFIPPGAYLISGKVYTYDRGAYGNGKWDNTLLPAYAVWYPNGANPKTSLIFNSGEKTLSDKEFPTAVFQEVVNYVDDDPTANENFTGGTGVLYTGTYRGYSANTTEATTQQMVGIYSIIRHEVAGIVGAVPVQGRLYIPSEDDVPDFATYGGNKGVSVGGATFTSLHCDYGGYAYGMEIDCFDTVTKGTCPTYTPTDVWNDSNMKRQTAAINCVVGAKNQPIGASLLIMGAKLGSKATGAWNAVYIGGSTTLIDGNSGVSGTVGINFAGWRKNGNYAHTAIKFDYAVRHVVAKSGLKIQSSKNDIMPQKNTDLEINLIRGGSTNIASIVWRGGVDVDSDADMDNASEIARIFYNTNAYRMEYRSYGTQLFMVGRQTAQSPQKIYYMTGTEFRPSGADFVPNLGSTSNPFGVAYIKEVSKAGVLPVRGNGVLLDAVADEDNTVYLKRYSNSRASEIIFCGDLVENNGTVDSYTYDARIKYVKSASQFQLRSTGGIFLQVADDLSSNLKGYVLNSNQLRPAHTSKPSLGDATRPFGAVYGTTLNLDGVTLNSTQLSALLALI